MTPEEPQRSRTGSDESRRRFRCAVWGVLNVTPDSFSDGGEHLDPDHAVTRGLAMCAEGADVIDVGGESSRPAGKTYGEGFAKVPAAEEIRRVVPVIAKLAQAGVVVSIDTVKPEVAREALAAGARFVNDVSGGRDDALLRVAADAGASYVLMHTRGRGEVERPNTDYRDVVEDVLRELLAVAARAEAIGVERSKLWLDPGIGFAKTPRQSARLLAATDAFVATGHPILVGPSRKSFLAELAPNADGSRPAPKDRLGGTAAAVTAAVLRGAHAIRVHDVRMMAQAVRVAEALRSCESEKTPKRDRSPRQEGAETLGAGAQ